MDTSNPPSGTGDQGVDALIALAQQVKELECRLDNAGAFVRRRTAEMELLKERMDSMESRLSLDVVTNAPPKRVRRAVVLTAVGVAGIAVGGFGFQTYQMHIDQQIIQQTAYNGQQTVQGEKAYQAGHTALVQQVQKIANALTAHAAASDAQSDAKADAKPAAKHKAPVKVAPILVSPAKKSTPVIAKTSAVITYHGRHHRDDDDGDDYRRGYDGRHRGLDGFGHEVDQHMHELSWTSPYPHHTYPHHPYHHDGCWHGSQPTM